MLFALLLIVAVLYTQTNTTSSRLEADKVLLSQQEVAKNYQLAEAALSKFTSDAIAMRIRADVCPGLSVLNCPSGAADGIDFKDDIVNYWDFTTGHLLSKFGIDKCSVDVNRDTMAPIYANTDKNFFPLTCRHRFGTGYYSTSQFIRGPFALKKDVVFARKMPNKCQVTVRDALSDTPYDEVTFLCP
jgi:hypothetical protein